MKDRSIVSSLVSGAVALLILGGHAKHSGSVSSELPNVEFTKTGAADYHARIGSGGQTINVQGNSGSVLLINDRE